MVQRISDATPALVCHYDEIALKGGNRPLYERILLDRFREQLAALGVSPTTLRVSHSRVMAELPEIPPDSVWEEAQRRLAWMPGVASFGLGVVLPRDASEEALVEAVVGVGRFPPEGTATFRISARRVDKTYPHTSLEIEQWLGAQVGERMPQLRVSLRAPDYNIFVEVLPQVFLVWVQHKGVGGLPVGSSGNAVALLSSGFDSPVASYLMMKRGVRVHWLHFHAEPATSQEGRSIARSLARYLVQWGDREMCFASLNLHLITQLLLEKAPVRLRVVLLRRSMMRLAERWARSLGAHALVTGESVGQVASQTLENMETIEAATSLPVLRPLAGYNKNEILYIARQLGTYDLSARKCDDTCAMLTTKHPATKSDPAAAHHIEEQIGIQSREALAYETLEVEHLWGEDM